MVAREMRKSRNDLGLDLKPGIMGRKSVKELEKVDDKTERSEDDDASNK